VNLRRRAADLVIPEGNVRMKTMQTQELPAPPEKATPREKKTGRRRWLSPLAVVVAFALGVTIGLLPTDQGELEDAQAMIATLRGDLDAAEQEAADRLEELQAKQSELSAVREGETGSAEEVARLEGRVAELESKLADAREEAKVAAPPKPGPKRTITDGLWKVGEEVAPGTYRSGGGGSCYWARLSGFSGDLDDIITNGIGRNQTVTISPSDVGFESSGCGTWTRI
jgi:hypothetical protein